MKKYSLDDICAFAARTGDTVIALLPSGEAFVVQNFEDYRKMVENKEDIGSLSEDEMLARINREIALWKSRQQAQGTVDSADGYDILDAPSENPYSREQNGHEQSVGS